MKFNLLTVTRFFAAMGIVIFHFKDNVFPFSLFYIKEVLSYFNGLVTYFFVLSGFILSLNYKSPFNIKRYYLNRFARIYPLYLFALFLTLSLISVARNPYDQIRTDKVLYSITLIQSWMYSHALTYNFPSWSLSCEAFFYLLFPYILIIAKKNKTLFYIGLIISWLCIQLYFYSNENGYRYLYNPLCHLFSFVIGIAGAFFYLDNSDWIFEKINLIKKTLLALSLLVLSLMLSHNNILKNTYSYGVLAPYFILCIYLVVYLQRESKYENELLTYLGEVSYSIYILQFPISIFVFGILSRIGLNSHSIGFYIYLLVLIFISILTYECIEKPCKRHINNFFIVKYQF